MSLYRKLSRKPKLFLSVTGMNFHQFQTLLPKFEQLYHKLERRRKRKVVVTDHGAEGLAPARLMKPTSDSEI